VPIDPVALRRETALADRQPTRAPDYQAESRALVALAQEMTVFSPDRILRKLGETALELCGARSAGLSLPLARDRQGLGAQPQRRHAP
jgi:hypothetical protein